MRRLWWSLLRKLRHVTAQPGSVRVFVRDDESSRFELGSEEIQRQGVRRGYRVLEGSRVWPVKDPSAKQPAGLMHRAAQNACATARGRRTRGAPAVGTRALKGATVAARGMMAHRVPHER